MRLTHGGRPDDRGAQRILARRDPRGQGSPDGEQRFAAGRFSFGPVVDEVPWGSDARAVLLDPVHPRRREQVPRELHHATYAFSERSSGNVGGRSERTPSSAGGAFASASIFGASRTYLSISHWATVDASVGLATKGVLLPLGVPSRCEMRVSGLSNSRRVFGGHWSAQSAPARARLDRHRTTFSEFA